MRKIALLALSIALTLAACGGGKSSSASSTSASQAAATSAAAGAPAAGSASSGPMQAAMPNCGAVQPVWVNLSSKVYHSPGDPYYGKTAHGEYLCPSQAKAQGFRPAGGAGGSMAKHHHSSDSSM